jgi:phage anti-repressor protein
MQKAKFSIELAQAFFSSSEDFPVDLDDAWGWLGYAEKRNALRKLTGNFQENKDYTFARSGEQDVPLTFGDFQPSNPNKYRLTVDCFKRLAMLAETDQGDQVRTYFIQCENTAKLLAAEVPTLKAEVARLSALMEQPQGTAFSGTAAHRPDPAAYIKGMRCEANLVWADLGPFDPETALRMVKNSMLAADSYLQSWVDTACTTRNPSAGAVVDNATAERGDVIRLTTTVADGGTVYQVPPLSNNDKIAQFTWAQRSGGGRVITRSCSKILQEAVRAALLQLPRTADYFDLYSLKLAVLTDEALVEATKPNSRIGLSLRKGINLMGFVATTQHNYREADCLLYGKAKGFSSWFYKRVSSGGAV